ncbi:VOC family protein [Nocardiopsis trehalosi]|jgi:predicted enzyme related to lactoylglutathione lyase|uniref:VOC family protein n=1 Tax=Nocardiopsis trehalosi TaxID=109329 RepID=UPI00082E5EAE|nr:VOC family protein [Nocardiopsis trehalosi]
MWLKYVLDTNDLRRSADFWSAALGFTAEEPHPPYLTLRDPSGRWPILLLQDVPEPKSGKNRMHLDIHVDDLDAESARLRGLGATEVDAPWVSNGNRLTVLAAPDGNEFCVIQELRGDG